VNLLTKTAITSGIVLSSISLSAVNANAVGISGLGDPITNPALTGGTVIDFDAGPTGVFSNITFGNVTFTGVDAPLTIGSDYIGSYNTRGVNSMYNDFDYIPSQFRFDFATPVNAFGFNWGASDNDWLLSAFDSGGGLIETLTVPKVFSSNAGEYFGIAASGIAFATLVDQKDRIAEGDYVFIDNFTYVKQQVSVPEPSSVLGLGLLGFGAFFKRKFNQKQKQDSDKA
jgi:hypothetical protein